MQWHELETFSFGDNPALADKLAALVLEGRKRATCWAVCEGLLTTVGKRMVMLDGSGRPRAVLETVELTQCRFDDVDEQWLLLGSGVVGCLTRPSRRRERRAEPCRGDGRCARTGRNRDTAAVCLAICRGAGAARSAAATRSLRWC